MQKIADYEEGEAVALFTKIISVNKKYEVNYKNKT